VAVRIRVLVARGPPVTVVVGVEKIGDTVIVGVLARCILRGRGDAVAVVVGIEIIGQRIGIGIAASRKVGAFVTVGQAVAVIVPGDLVVGNRDGGGCRAADGDPGVARCRERDLHR